MTDIRVAAEQAISALETAKTGLAWYRDTHPESVDGSDDEANDEIDAALASLEAALAALPGDKGQELHAAIMNLPCTSHAETGSDWDKGFRYGHRKARHDAAELALFHSAATPAVEVPPIAGRDGASAAPSDEGSAQ